jgi:beta-lactamase regulating signal transducer with metallopeptidase domain
VVALAASIAILIVLVTRKTKNTKFSPTKKIKIWRLVRVFAALTWIGANPVEPPYEKIGQVVRAVYFINIISI